MQPIRNLIKRLRQSNTVRLGVGQALGSVVAVLGGELTWRQGAVVALIGVLQVIQREWKLKKEENDSNT